METRASLKWKRVAVAIDKEHQDDAAALEVGCTVEPYIPRGSRWLYGDCDSRINVIPREGKNKMYVRRSAVL
jgi:hypothetical protein